MLSPTQEILTFLPLKISLKPPLDKSSKPSPISKTIESILYQNISK